jgi:HlyD family secretion protein
MKKKTILILLVLVAVATAAIFYFRSGKKNQAINFVTAKAQYGYIAKTVTATGNIQPEDTVSVGAQVSGVVKNVYVDFNSEVKQGQLLARVDASIIEAQAQQSRANLVSAQSNLAYQKNTYERQSKLFNLGAISQADYQLALNQYNNAKAGVDNSAAQLRLVQKNLSYTDIYSPINGVVLNRNVSEGQTIASSFNAPTLFVIAKDLTKMQVNAAVDEADIGGVRTGQNITFTVDAFPDDIFGGSVQQILLHPSVSANVVTYKILINVDNRNMKLKPGMTASINIYIEEDTNALLIPSRALSFKPDTVLLKSYKIIRAQRDSTGGGTGKRARNNQINPRDTANKIKSENATIRRSFVWVKSGDTLREKRVLTGLNDDSFVKVIRGLSPGDEVISNMATGDTKSNGNNTQRSPFMPQMQQRRPATGGRN